MSCDRDRRRLTGGVFFSQVLVLFIPLVLVFPLGFPNAVPQMRRDRSVIVEFLLQ